MLNNEKILTMYEKMIRNSSHTMMMWISLLIKQFYSRIKLMIQKERPEIRKEIFKRYIDNSKRFQLLKEKNPAKFKKYITVIYSELYKEGII